jgi:hypothetical protein
VGAPWHFREVEVLNQSTGVTARFLYDNWLDRTKSNPSATVTLKEVNSAEAKAGINKVRVFQWTGRAPGMWTPKQGGQQGCC